MNSKISLAIAFGMALASGSATAGSDAVATVVSVEGKALIENAEGARQVAAPDAVLAEGSSVITLEGAKVGLQYTASQCQIMHNGNTLVSVTAASQCVAGQQLAVGQGAGAASAGGAATGSAAATGAAAGVSAGTSVGAGLAASASAVGGTAAAAATSLASAAIPAAVSAAVVATGNAEANGCDKGKGGGLVNNPHCPGPVSP